MGSRTEYWLQLVRSAYSRQDSPIADKILADQLREICDGARFSMPISTILSVLILLVQIAAGHFWMPIIWFALVNIINALRLIDAIAYYRSPAAPVENIAVLQRQLARFQLFGAMAGFVWAGVAILSHGFSDPQSSVYLVILAGICAGAVTYGSSYAAVAINFITPPLVVTVVCLVLQADLQYGVIAVAVVLFWLGLTRGALLGQNRFIQTSRLKHEAKQLADEMALKSQEDPLTGLFNRRGLETSIRLYPVKDGPFIVMLIDLDGFKSVNDTYGHKVGDDLLVAIAQRIRQVSPERSVLARIGGDEFVLAYPEPSAKIEAALVAARIIGSLTAHYGDSVGGDRRLCRHLPAGASRSGRNVAARRLRALCGQETRTQRILFFREAFAARVGAQAKHRARPAHCNRNRAGANLLSAGGATLQWAHGWF